MSDANLDAILAELAPREPIFHQRAFGTSREDLLKMTGDDFWEIGASGRIYSREFVIENLPERYKTPEIENWSCSEFSVTLLSDGLYQLNYVLQQPDRRTRRTIIWRRTDSGWQIVFHQGTVIM